MTIRDARAPLAWCAGVVFVCLLLAGSVAFAALTFPTLTGRVVDQAAILSSDTERHLVDLSAQAEQHDGVQIVTVTLKSLQGTTIEDYGVQLGRAWGIGQKGKDNGVLLIVAPSEREVRIEVGYGLEGKLTDAQSRIIIETLILPQFKKGDYNAGVVAGATAIMQAVTGALPATTAARQPVAQDDSNDSIVPFIIFLVIVFFLGGRGLLWPLLFMGMSGRRGGGFGGGDFSDGGGFSGGGGSFGGGGASGKW